VWFVLGLVVVKKGGRGLVIVRVETGTRRERGKRAGKDWWVVGGGESHAQETRPAGMGKPAIARSHFIIVETKFQRGTQLKHTQQWSRPP
jgi:hypothetical protein